MRTGKRLWNFNTIPPRRVWERHLAQRLVGGNGNVGVWNQISVDEDLGLAYLPVETPTSDFYGGHRPGNNLFADSIVAVDLKTGQRKWHYQLVHHSLWNFDVSAAPILADITVNGRPVKAVIAMTKAAMMYVLDRTNGQPVWPIEERPAPKGDVPGEWYSPTQPYPTKPPAYDLQGVTRRRADRLHAGIARAGAAGTWRSTSSARSSRRRWSASSKGRSPASARLAAPTGRAGPTIRKPTSRLFPHSSRFRRSALMPPPNKEFSDVNFVEGFADRGVRYVTGPGEDAGADAPPPGGDAGPLRKERAGGRAWPRRRRTPPAAAEGTGAAPAV